MAHKNGLHTESRSTQGLDSLLQVRSAQPTDEEVRMNDAYSLNVISMEKLSELNK